MKGYTKNFLLAGLTAAVLGFSGTAAFATPVADPKDSLGVIDIKQIDAVYTATDLTFMVDFFDEITPAFAGLANSLYGPILIDTDQDPGTGIDGKLLPDLGFLDFGLIGAEFAIVLEFTDGHSVVLFDLLGGPVELVPVVFNSTSYSVTVPLSDLGGDDGVVDYLVVHGISTAATDKAPNSGLATSMAPVPEPSTMLLLGSGLVGLVGWRMRKQYQTAT